MLMWDFLPGPGEGAVPICSEAWEGQSPVTQVCDRPPPARRVREMRPSEAIPGFVQGQPRNPRGARTSPCPSQERGLESHPPGHLPSAVRLSLEASVPRELR